MRTGDEFIEGDGSKNAILVRVDKITPVRDVVFYAGVDEIAGLKVHYFWPTDKWGNMFEAGHKFPNDNIVQFECFKSVTNDPDAFCPGCMVEQHTGTKPINMYYSPVVLNGEDGAFVLEMKASVGNALRQMIKNDFIAEDALDKFSSFWFKVIYDEKKKRYELSRSLKQLPDDFELPEVPDVEQLLKNLRIIRTMDDVVLEMQLENLWTDAMNDAYELYEAEHTPEAA